MPVTSSAPPLYDEYEVVERLNPRGYELEGLLNVGIIAPVAHGIMGQPLYCAAAIDHLATREQGRRLADARWWDFDLKRPGYMPGHLPWARAVDLPCYPFDDEEQQAWARRVYRLKKQTAPFPYPYPGTLGPLPIADGRQGNQGVREGPRHQAGACPQDQGY